MSQLDFVFEESPWELEIGRAKKGSAVSARRLMALLEGEEEDTAIRALEQMDERGVLLDISDLPPAETGGQTGDRLALEEKLAAQEDFGSLPEDDPLRLYLEELADLPGDREQAAKAMAAGRENAGKELADALLPRVAELSREYTGHGVLLSDLIQEGNLGLWQGIGAYTGGDPLDFCERYIRNALARAVFLQGRENGVGQRLRRDMERFSRADRELLTRLGRNPTIEEIALELGVPVEEADSMEEILTSARQMERAKSAMTPKMPTPEEEQAVENTAYFQSRQRIEELLSGLEPQDRELISLRFGLDGSLPASPEETGKKLQMTAEEVVEREEKLLRSLRER